MDGRDPRLGRQGVLTIPGITLLLMCIIMIGGMFIGFNYSRVAGFFTMASWAARFWRASRT